MKHHFLDLIEKTNSLLAEATRVAAQYQQLQTAFETVSNRLVEITQERDNLLSEFIKLGPHEDEARATVIWQDDQQVTQQMWDSTVAELQKLRNELQQKP